MSEPLLEIENLHVHFETADGRAQVINGVDLAIETGEKVGVVGESGCGKSVTAKMILGLLRNSAARVPEGKIKYNGTDLLSLSDSEHHNFRGNNISLIMQDPMTSLNPSITVGEQMVDVLKWQNKESFRIRDWIQNKFESHEDLRRRAIEMLKRVNIPAPERVFDSYPVELSGGMRQRILISIALLSDPDLLIADEPGTALDVTTEEKILEILDSIVSESGTAVLYITHDMGVAKEMTDVINVMYAGEIVENASTKNIFQAPRHPYTRGLLDSVPSLSGEQVSGIDGQLPDYTDPPSGCRFVDRCPYAESDCKEVPPHPRNPNPNHSVSCHIYGGEYTHERHQKLDDAGNVNVPQPDWNAVNNNNNNEYPDEKSEVNKYE